MQASAALTEALLDDPFYEAIAEGLKHDLEARKGGLMSYFQYSLAEAERTGRCVFADDPGLGAAAWLLPRSADVDAAESAAKAAFLAESLGSRGAENYYRIVRFMVPLAARLVPEDAWYLSIIGILPSAQGRGLGEALLAGTLAEASRLGASCYLETFTPRNLKFYERMGFLRVGEQREPTTNEMYVIMLKDA